MLVFSTQFSELLPLLSSLWFNSPPTPPLHCVQVQIIQTVWLGGDVHGVLNPLGDHILQEFNILCLTRFRTLKIARPSKNKT
jgi:hypothetical protein